MAFIILYITSPDKPTANKIAKHLLKKRLIACANLFPISSIYWWNTKLTAGKEFVLLAKTSCAKYAAAKKEIEKIHPYKCPCIITLPASANKAYETWLQEQLSSQASR